MSSNIAKYNGKFTVTSTKTGEHRTFRIRTQPKDSSFAPGERIISLLTGSDNQNSYTGFGFVKEGGKIIVWKKKHGGQFEQYARMMENLATHEESGRVIVQAETTCRKCNKCLTDPVSIATGLGPICGNRETEKRRPGLRAEMAERAAAREVMRDMEWKDRFMTAFDPVQQRDARHAELVALTGSDYGVKTVAD